jgi:probable HAF family extracellular repeat protein
VKLYAPSRRLPVAPAAALVLLAVCAPTRAQVSFQLIPRLPGGQDGPAPLAVSGDGSVVVGRGQTLDASFQERIVGFRWTQATGTVSLGVGPNSVESEARDVSFDGAYAAGDAYRRAYYWTPEGIQDIGTHPMSDYAFIYAISGDGTTLVGNGRATGGKQATLWTQAGGWRALGDLPGRDVASSANDVSFDGSVVVGTGTSANGTEAFRWTEAGGMVGLGFLNPANPYSAAFAVSADGGTVVGISSVGDRSQGFRWTAETGMVALRTDGGWTSSYMDKASADAAVLTGTASGTAGSVAVFYTEATGFVPLKSYLEAHLPPDQRPPDLAEMTFRLYGVSADGTTLVGTMSDPRNRTFQGFRLRDETAFGTRLIGSANAPEPATLGLLTCVLPWLATRRRKK